VLGGEDRGGGSRGIRFKRIGKMGFNNGWRKSETKGSRVLQERDERGEREGNIAMHVGKEGSGRGGEPFGGQNASLGGGEDAKEGSWGTAAAGLGQERGIH